jgi:hypothetical protein
MVKFTHKYFKKRYFASIVDIAVTLYLLFILLYLHHMLIRTLHLNLPEIQSSSHHAILFTCVDRVIFAKNIWEKIRHLSVANIFHNHTVIDIETVRTLITWAQSPYEGEKVALLSFHTITLPAQNALLKIIEEPLPTVRFIFITSNKESLIPTFLSRVQYLQHSEDENKDMGLAEIFFATDSNERTKLKDVTTLLNATDEEGRKNREAVRSFIISLANFLKTKKQDSRYTVTTLEMASYAGDPSASGKAIIEYLALFLPQVKN